MATSLHAAASCPRAREAGPAGAALRRADGHQRRRRGSSDRRRGPPLRRRPGGACRNRPSPLRGRSGTHPRCTPKTWRTASRARGSARSIGCSRGVCSCRDSNGRRSTARAARWSTRRVAGRPQGAPKSSCTKPWPAPPCPDLATATDGSRVLGTYVPLALGSGRVGGVVRLEQDYGPIAASAQRFAWLVAGVLEALLLVLLLVFVPVLARAASRIRAHVRELEYHVLHDELTGLPNRQAFRGEAMQMVAAQGDGVLAILDIDGFTEIEETLGSAAATASCSRSPSGSASSWTTPLLSRDSETTSSAFSSTSQAPAGSTISPREPHAPCPCPSSSVASAWQRR